MPHSALTSMYGRQHHGTISPISRMGVVVTQEVTSRSFAPNAPIMNSHPALTTALALNKKRKVALNGTIRVASHCIICTDVSWVWHGLNSVIHVHFHPIFFSSNQSPYSTHIFFISLYPHTLINDKNDIHLSTDSCAIIQSYSHCYTITFHSLCYQHFADCNNTSVLCLPSALTTTNLWDMSCFTLSILLVITTGQNLPFANPLVNNFYAYLSGIVSFNSPFIAYHVHTGLRCHFSEPNRLTTTSLRLATVAPRMVTTSINNQQESDSHMPHLNIQYSMMNHINGASFVNTPSV